MKKDILIIAATHGDERIGLDIVGKLKTSGLGRYFDVRIGNPRALAKNARYTDFDLNRAYPGDPRASEYEKRRAYYNLRIARQYCYVLDIHEADRGSDDFIIVPQPTLDCTVPLELIDLDTVILWPDPNGPLGYVLNNTIELEFGMKNRNRNIITDNATRIVRTFINSIASKGKKQCAKKKFYRVYGTVSTDDPRIKGMQLKDFTKARLGNESFYPLLVDQYREQGIYCYNMMRL